MIKVYLHFDYEGDDWHHYNAIDTKQADEMLLKLYEDNDFCYYCYYTPDGERRTAIDVMKDRENQKYQLDQISQILKDNLVRLDCWDWKNDTFNEAYVSEYEKIAKTLYDQGIRVIKTEENDKKMTNCSTCKSISNCDTDKQAFYSFADKHCEEYKPDIKTKKKCKYKKYTKRLDNCRFDCSDCPIEKSINSIIENIKQDRRW